MKLREIADVRISARRRFTQNRYRAAIQRYQSESCSDQGRLSGAVCAEHADELARADLQIDVVQDDAAAERDADAVKLERVHYALISRGQR